MSIITQNVDDLHELADTTNVLHLHGELSKVTGPNNPNDSRCIREMPLDQPVNIRDKATDGSQNYGSGCVDILKEKQATL